MKYKIGVIGLGTMGHSIALQLNEQGLLRAVYDLDVTKGYDFHDIAMTSIPEMTNVCNLFLLCLPNSHAVQSVVELLSNHVQQQAVILDLSTNSPTVTRIIHQLCIDKGIYYLEAPMTGGVRAVRAKALRIIVGGDEAVFGDVLPVFTAFSSDATYVGPIGTASSMKLIHNMITLGNALVAMEAIMIGERIGLTSSLMFDVIERGTASSYVIQNTLKRTLLNHDFHEGFKLNLAAKDLRLAKELAQSAGIHLYILDRIVDVFQEAAQDPELASLDYPIVCRYLAKTLGISQMGGIVP